MGKENQIIVRKVVAFILASVSAYALSFSIDIFVGNLLGIYDNTARIPVFTWSVISLVTGWLALHLLPEGWFLATPFAFFALFAAFGGIVGHRYNFIVAVVMAVGSAGIWLTTTRRGKA